MQSSPSPMKNVPSKPRQGATKPLKGKGWTRTNTKREGA